MKQSEEKTVLDNEHTPNLQTFFQTKTFKYTFWIGIMVVVTLACLIIVEESQTREFSLTKDAVDYFFTDMMVVPFKVAAGVLAIIAILAWEHRSQLDIEQKKLTLKQMELTRQQIETTTQQNIYSNYYTHRKEFTQYAEEYLKESTYFRKPDYQKIQSLYRKLFPESQKGTIDKISLEVAQELENKSQLILESIHSQNKEDFKKFSEELISNLALRNMTNHKNAINVHGVTVRFDHVMPSFLKEYLRLIVHCALFSGFNQLTVFAHTNTLIQQMPSDLEMFPVETLNWTPSR
ncbi:hypothetical protein [Vibrio nigripulchritudo]|uniref:hypothetical protein n=1 Tax=Vibrio nigripulchritudo TaxID=28173 RepID=UPI0003B1C343|nr:hypothetical protein [Vibrio nigripulchritudo]CCN69779.1 hypothetical protein VIBNISFn118_150033 [Vibrio nigripulchritudo SFn118]